MKGFCATGELASTNGEKTLPSTQTNGGFQAQPLGR
jgi:hypothetical protein